MGSDTLNRAFLNLRAGEDVWARDGVEAKEYFAKISKKYNFDDWDMNTRREVQLGSQKVQLTLGQMMSLYAYSKRKASHEHLRYGGFIFDPKATYKGKKENGKGLTIERLVADSTRYTMDEITIMNLASTLGLTKEQIGFVDEMQQYLSKDLAAKGNEVSLELYGIKLFNDEFYLPMIVASEYLDSATGKTGDPKIKNKGMTKKLTPDAKNPLVLMDFMDVWKRHVNDMALYHGMTLPMEDMNKLLNYRETFGLDEKTVSDKIVLGMSDAERTEILRFKRLENVPAVKEIPDDVISKIPEISSWEDINKYFGSEKRTLIHKIASEFGVFQNKKYSNSDINLSFEFSNNNFRESYSKQGQNYESFAKLFSVFNDVVNSAVGIEVHNRNAKNYKPDPTLKNAYVLMSAFENGDKIIPVKLEVKEFNDKQNTLYVAITLEGIEKAEVWKSGSSNNDVAQSSRSANISIPDLMKKVNPLFVGADNGNLNPNLRRRVFLSKIIKSQIMQTLRICVGSIR